jgi:hypothetical protein
MTIAVQAAPRRSGALMSLGRIDAAIALFAVFGGLMASGLAAYHDRPWSLISLVAVPAALWLRRRPTYAAAAIVIGSIILRLAYVGIGFTDQVAVSQAGAARALSGLSPYGVGYAETVPPGAPFPYGPLALVWWLPGPAVELVAATLLMILLVKQRSWLTLGLFASVPFAVYLTTTGTNDYSPGLLIAAALMLVRDRPYVGAAVLALAAALKPYALAWLPSLIGLAGWRAGAVMLGLSAVLWSPLMAWGVGGFFRSLELSRSVHPVGENALNLPILRFAALPIAMLGLVAHRWETAVLVGSAAFFVFLFLDRWASLGYLIAVGPITGIALERWAFTSRPGLT